MGGHGLAQLEESDLSGAGPEARVEPAFKRMGSVYVGGPRWAGTPEDAGVEWLGRGGHNSLFCLSPTPHRVHQESLESFGGSDIAVGLSAYSQSPATRT